MICKHDSLARSCHICYLESEIESLKAIKELAVKGLKEIRDFVPSDSMFAEFDSEKLKATRTLSEIERLQNG